jgi:hypothetical protein
MILAKDDTISSSDLIRDAFARAGGPKQLLEVEGGHYSVYPWSRGQSADRAGRAATDWFTQHLLASPERASAKSESGPDRWDVGSLPCDAQARESAWSRRPRAQPKRYIQMEAEGLKRASRAPQRRLTPPRAGVGSRSSYGG